MEREKDRLNTAVVAREKKKNRDSDGLIIDIFKKMLEYNFQEMGKKKDF
ncbi:hypothetical protein [Desulfomarina sp.]